VLFWFSVQLLSNSRSWQFCERAYKSAPQHMSTTVYGLSHITKQHMSTTVYGLSHITKQHMSTTVYGLSHITNQHMSTTVYGLSHITHDLPELPHVSTTERQRRSAVTRCLRKANIYDSIVKTEATEFLESLSPMYQTVRRQRTVACSQFRCRYGPSHRHKTVTITVWMWRDVT
jgi:hypothetical protein